MGKEKAEDCYSAFEGIAAGGSTQSDSLHIEASETAIEVTPFGMLRRSNSTKKVVVLVTAHTLLPIGALVMPPTNDVPD